MDTATFLTIVTTLVAIILIAVGIYLILLLHEARNSLLRINKLLDRVEGAADFVETKIISPTTNAASIFSVLKEGMDFFRDLRKAVRSKSSSGETDYDQ